MTLAIAEALNPNKPNQSTYRLYGLDNPDDDPKRCPSQFTGFVTFMDFIGPMSDQAKLLSIEN